MEDFKDNDLLKDPFLERMFQKLPVEKVSADFTFQIMNQVHASVEPEPEPEKFRRQMIWAYASIGAGILIIALILFAIWPFFELNLKPDSAQILNLINATLSLFDGISSIFDYLRASSLQLTIIFSVFLIFFIERLLRKGITNGSASVS